MAGPLQNPFMFKAAAVDADFYTYQIANSCRFDRASSHYLNRTIQSGGNLDLWTLSFWVKLTASAGFGSNQYHILTSEDNSSGAYDAIMFDVNSSSQLYYQITNKYFVGNHSIRDPSAWYHVVIVFDSANGTAAHRRRVWVNNVEDTGSDVQTYSQNVDSQLNDNTVHNIGARQDENAAYFMDGYFADFIFVDGYAYAPTYFGESKNGCWIPKDYKTDTGNYGTTGYHLDFATTTLGNDVSGNNNDWTANNLTSDDQMLDSPTFNSDSNGGNFATLNPLDNTQNNGVGGCALTEGNLKVSGAGDNYGCASTYYTPATGKYYAEFYLSSGAGYDYVGYYPASEGPQGVKIWCPSGNRTWLTSNLASYAATGTLFKDGNTSTADWGDTFTNADIISIAIDQDNSAVYYAKNGVWQNSGDPESGASVTGAARTSIPDHISPAVGHANGSGTGVWLANYGADGSFAGALSGGDIGTETDATGYGAFKYEVPSGFLALCAGNLPTPAADPAEEEGPNTFFVPKLYTGDGEATLAITGLEFQPDLTWIKNRDATDGHCWFDSSRGVTELLDSSAAVAESTDADTLKSWTSDGFTVGADLKVNTDTEKYASWNWLINAGSTSTLTAGTIDTVVQVNTTAGISIMQFVGDGGSSDWTLAHGLGASPEFLLRKDKDTNSNNNQWGVWHQNMTADHYLYFSTTAAQAASTKSTVKSVSSTLFTFNRSTTTGGDLTWGESGDNYVYWAFVGKEGFSKFGNYEGNGDADGAFVYCGFRPALIWTKSIDSTSDWQIFDDLREGYNVDNDELWANLTTAEATTDMIDILSNGFKLRIATDPNVGETYIYAAWAKNPFKYATAR